MLGYEKSLVTVDSHVTHQVTQKEGCRFAENEESSVFDIQGEGPESIATYLYLELQLTADAIVVLGGPWLSMPCTRHRLHVLHSLSSPQPDHVGLFNR